MINKIRIPSFLNFKKIPVLNSLLSDDFLNKVTLRSTDNYKKKPIPLKVFLDDISPEIDEKVLAYAIKEGVKPLGGEIIISLNRDNITLKTNLYFQHNKKIILSVSEKKIDSKIFTKEDLKRVRDGSVKYDIDPPNLPKVF